MDGDFTDAHALMVRHCLDEIDRFNGSVCVFDARIAGLLPGLGLDLLDSVPGIGRMAAEIVLAETGGDMNHFPTAGTWPHGPVSAPGRTTAPE